MDVSELAEQVVAQAKPGLVAYGGRLLVDGTRHGVDRAARFAANLWRRVFGDDGPDDAVVEAMDAVASDPDDTDVEAALRWAVRRALAADPRLAAAVAADLAGAPVIANGERSVAVENNTGQILTGDNASAVQINGPVAAPAPPPPDETAAPDGLTNLPQRRDRGLFTGRETELAALRAHRPDDTTAVLAITGLGGVGKSELALQFARDRRRRYPFRWWITASSTAAVRAGLADLTRRLCRTQVRIGDTVIEAGDGDLAEWALAWLQCHSNWLLVCDNVERASDLREMIGQLAENPGSAIVVTSRRALDLPAAAIQLAPLARPSATELLLTASSLDSVENHHHAAGLVDDLGALPLGLQQAAAYLNRQRLSIAEYRRLLERRPMEMLTMAADLDEDDSTLVVPGGG